MFLLLDTSTGNVVGRYDSLEEARARRRDLDDPDLRVIWWETTGDGYGERVLHVDSLDWRERIEAFFAVLRRRV